MNTNDEPRALTLREPWASLICAGLKRIETRSWSTRYRGPLYIHAGALKICPADAHVQELLQLIPNRGMAYGLVVCRCVLADCLPMDQHFFDEYPLSSTERLCGQYAPGRFAWLLEDIEPLARPFPAKGKLGLWRLEP